MQKIRDHFFIFATVFFTVYSQIIMRWKVSSAGDLPDSLSGKIYFILNVFLNPWVASSILATLLAGISWMLAMSRFEISYAYPWLALNFLLMMLLGWWIFDEIINVQKLIGTIVVVTGLVIIARS